MTNEEFLNSIDEYATELYTEEEIFVIEDHIRRCFGEFTNVFHEIMSPKIHVDICVVPPGPGRNYYTLITLGMGAHQMNVPVDIEGSKGLRRAELVITLPPDWQVVSDEERWYWPVRLLKAVARLPIECDTWLGWGHTVDNGATFASNTRLSGSLLVSPQCGENDLNLDAGVCRLPNGDEVNFYHLIPVYPKEMDFKKMYGAEALITYALSEVSHIVDINRPDGCRDWKESDNMEGFMQDMAIASEIDELADMAGIDQCDLMDALDVGNIILDDGAWHMFSLRLKKLPVDELNVYSHIAIYMRWCMENDMISGPFFFRHVNMVDDVKANGFDTRVDLRVFMRDSEDIRGCLLTPFFNEKGAAFAQYYYVQGSGGYPAEVDKYARQYTREHFGIERVASGEFQDEDYLFVPFDENYYQDIKKLIDRRYDKWILSYTGLYNSMVN